MSVRARCRIAVISSAVIVGLAFGCGPGAQGTRSVVDDAGRTVVLPDSVRRVVSLAPNVTELLFAAGGGDLLVAVSSADDYPPEISRLPKLDALPVNFEAVLGLDPDLVILNAEINRIEDADRLAELGVSAFVTQTTSIIDVPANVRSLGGLLGTQDGADSHAQLLQAAMDSLASRVAGHRRPRVLLLIGYNTLYAFGENGFIHDVIALAGGESITATLKQNPVLNEEYVLAEDPEFILIASDDTFRPSDLVDAHPAFSELSAVISGRVHGIDADETLRPGPRLISGAYHMATIIHPNLFAVE